MVIWQLAELHSAPTKSTLDTTHPLFAGFPAPRQRRFRARAAFDTRRELQLASAVTAAVHRTPGFACLNSALSASVCLWLLFSFGCYLALAFVSWAVEEVNASCIHACGLRRLNHVWTAGPRAYSW